MDIWKHLPCRLHWWLLGMPGTTAAIGDITQALARFLSFVLRALATLWCCSRMAQNEA
jgi:hypothetical protein